METKEVDFVGDATGEQVKEACLAAGMKRVRVRDCSMCGYPCAYVIENGELFFDPGCDCTHRHHPEPRDWEAAASWINMQTKQEIKNEIAAKFGLFGSTKDEGE